MAPPRVTIDGLPDKATLTGTERILLQDGGVSKRANASAFSELAMVDHFDDVTPALDKVYSSSRVEDRLSELSVALTAYADALDAADIAVAAQAAPVVGIDVGTQLTQLRSMIDTDVAGLAAFIASLPFRIVSPAADMGAAINTQALALAATGGVVLVPPGTFDCATAISPPAGVWVRGAGRDVTILKLTGTNRGFSISNTPNVWISDLTIDCNKANTVDNGTTTQHGIFYSAFNSTGCPGGRIERVRVINAWDRGIAAAATTLDTHPLTLDILDVVVSGTGGTGIVIQNAQRSSVKKSDVSATLLWGIHIIGGRNATIYDNDCHHSAAPSGSRGHGIVVNTGHVGAIIDSNRCYSNTVDSATWGIVVGTSATEFTVVNNDCHDNSQNLTIDVSDGTATPIETKGIVANNKCMRATIGNGLHVNQADGLSIVGNHTAFNAQTGLEVYGRNATVLGNTIHDNGRHGLSFREDGVTAGTGPCGPHRVGENHSYDNNTSAGAFFDFHSDALTNGPVIWNIARTGDPEGNLRGGVGSQVRRLDGGASTTLYVKQSGTGNTGWVAK